MFFENAYFIIGTAYAGKSTMVKDLAKAHDGIACEENYHDNYPGELDAQDFPCLTYTRDLEDWHDFIRRSPQEYKDWIDGVKKECEILELRMLPEICSRGKKVFVDTNISIETLRAITPPDHVLVMLADPMISVHRFFDRPDPEKQFLYRLILEEPDPEAAMANYRQGLELINSQESYDRLLYSGFHVILRDGNRTIGETRALAEEALGLADAGVTVEKVGRDTGLAGKLLEYVENCSWEETREHIAGMIRDWAFTDWETMFAAMKDGKIIGMASVLKEDYYPLPEIFPWVSCIFVSEEYRGKKISGKLIDSANRYLKEQGFDRSYIPTEYTGLYEHFGYRYVRDIVNYGGGTDRLYVKEF